jgi:hypothetical protein
VVRCVSFNRRDRTAARKLLDPEVVWAPTQAFFERAAHGRDAALVWFGEGFDAGWDEIRLARRQMRRKRDEKTEGNACKVRSRCCSAGRTSRIFSI